MANNSNLKPDKKCCSRIRIFNSMIYNGVNTRTNILQTKNIVLAPSLVWANLNPPAVSFKGWKRSFKAGAELGGGRRGCAPPLPPPEITCGFLIQLVFCKKKTKWFIGVEVEQETSAPPPRRS